MRELEKNSPVPVRKEMSMTEYSKLVDTNANLVDKIKEQQEIIKKMQENQDSAIKIMKMYKDYKLRVDKAIEWVNNHIETYTQNGIGIIDWNYDSDPRKLLKILKGECYEIKENKKIA